jgi:hypothetical protein
MSDHDELLARADAFGAEDHDDFDDRYILVAELAVALRAALATQPQPDDELATELRRMAKGAFPGGPVESVLLRAAEAVAGSATPTDYDDNGWETLRHDIPEEGEEEP